MARVITAAAPKDPIEGLTLAMAGDILREEEGGGEGGGRGCTVTANFMPL
jgi:hypothetical protein